MRGGSTFGTIPRCSFSLFWFPLVGQRPLPGVSRSRARPRPWRLQSHPSPCGRLVVTHGEADGGHQTAWSPRAGGKRKPSGERRCRVGQSRGTSRTSVRATEERRVRASGRGWGCSCAWKTKRRHGRETPTATRSVPTRSRRGEPAVKPVAPQQLSCVLEQARPPCPVHAPTLHCGQELRKSQRALRQAHVLTPRRVSREGKAVGMPTLRKRASSIELCWKLQVQVACTLEFP